MKLTNKLRTGILATTLTGLIGCAEFEEIEDVLLEQMIFQGAAARLREKGEHDKARAVENIGLIRGNIAAAEAGRSEVNVYTNGGREQQRTRWQLPENVILSSDGNYNPVQGYEWVNPKNNKDLRVRKKQQIPENVIVLSNGERRPSQGYEWANPKNRDDLRVRRINSQTQTRENIGHGSEEGMMLTYGEWVDSDGNGHWNIKELTDVKIGEPQERNSSNPFYFLVYSGPTGGFSTLKIVNTDTKELIFDETLTYGHAHWGPNEPTLYKPGNYKGMWFRNGKLKSELEIKVVAE